MNSPDGISDCSGNGVLILKTSTYSLRTGILAHLGFLILSALLLMNMVMVKFAERDLIRSRLEAGKLLLSMLQEKMGDEISGKIHSLEVSHQNERLSRELEQLVRVSGFSRYLVVNRRGSLIFESGSWGGFVCFN